MLECCITIFYVILQIMYVSNYVWMKNGPEIKCNYGIMLLVLELMGLS